MLTTFDWCCHTIFPCRLMSTFRRLPVVDMPRSNADRYEFIHSFIHLFLHSFVLFSRRLRPCIMHYGIGPRSLSWMLIHISNSNSRTIRLLLSSSTSFAHAWNPPVSRSKSPSLEESEAPYAIRWVVEQWLWKKCMEWMDYSCSDIEQTETGPVESIHQTTTIGQYWTGIQHGQISIGTRHLASAPNRSNHHRLSNSNEEENEIDVQVPACTILTKPTEKVLVRYDKIPTNLWMTVSIEQPTDEVQAIALSHHNTLARYMSCRYFLFE